jgi:Fe-S cluster assembly protein SufB
MSFIGLSAQTVKNISQAKAEPAWMLDLRLKALAHFEQREMPTWGADLSAINFGELNYFHRELEKPVQSWDDVPESIKTTFDELGIPQAERKFLAGVATQYESEVIYESLKQEFSRQGVVFLDTDSALKEYPEIFQRWFGKVIPFTDNKFAALNTAVWSGGSFIYVPKGVKLSVPLQAYFFIRSKQMGQFERTLIVADEGSEVHYIEGCSAPMYSQNSLHSAVVELIALPGARIRYTTIQNWAGNIFNLVTKRALAHAESVVEWVDCNLGSQVTMKYPSVILKETKAHGAVLSLATAKANQHQDTGAKMIHLAPYTSSVVQSKSICQQGGRTSYRGMVRMGKNAHHSKAKVNCDALILDDISQTDTYPYNIIEAQNCQLEHEASASKLSEQQLYYLRSRGLDADAASSLIVSGFIEPITKELPMEYAAEMNALIRLEMTGSVG